MISGSVSGQTELRQVQATLTVSAPAQLHKDILAGTRAALRPLEKDIKTQAGVVLPHRGGYAAIIARAAKASVRVTGGKTVRASVSVTAKGKRENRDLPRLNRGELRHPVFGRYRMTKKGLQKNPWKAQFVAPGLVDDPVDRARDRVVDNAREAANRYADTITRG